MIPSQNPSGLIPPQQDDPTAHPSGMIPMLSPAVGRLGLAAEISTSQSCLSGWPQPLILSTCCLPALPRPQRPLSPAPEPVTPHDPTRGCHWGGTRGQHLPGLRTKEKQKHLLWVGGRAEGEETLCFSLG